MKNIPQIEKQISDMIVLDSIIANEDRHFNNFGFIRNSQTLEWKCLAPVFDSGTSMFLNEPLRNLESGIALIDYKVKSKPFAKTHTEQLKKLPCRKLCNTLPFENLDDIEDIFEKIFSSNEDFPENRKKLLRIIPKRQNPRNRKTGEII